MSQNKIVGVDSGKSGCICELDFDDMRCRWMPMPWVEQKKIDKSADILQAGKVLKAFDFKTLVVYLEQVQANPRFVNSNFAFGANYAQIQMILYHSAARLNWVCPDSWQPLFYKKSKVFKAKEQSKVRFLSMNDRTFKPENFVATHHTGLMDAFLIAVYGALKEKKILAVDRKFNFIFEKID